MHLGEGPEMLDEDAVRRALVAADLRPHSLVITSLDSQAASINIEPDRYLYPASMLKTPLAAAALELVQRGELHLETPFVVYEGCITANDTDSPFILGYRSPLEFILERAITHSDNVATNMLFDICGRERASRIVQEIFGLPDTAFFRKLSGSEPLIVDPQWDGTHRNRHSARDAARLFELIAHDHVPHAERLRNMLAKQYYNNKLSVGLDPNDRFEHKTGDTDEVTHDGGILRLPSGARYVVVVYTGLESTDAHNERFGHFMKSIRPLLEPSR